MKTAAIVVHGMTLDQLHDAAGLMGMRASRLAEALAPADPALCGWLDGTCTRARHGDDLLCLRHLAHMADLAERR